MSISARQLRTPSRPCLARPSTPRARRFKSSSSVRLAPAIRKPETCSLPSLCLFCSPIGEILSQPSNTSLGRSSALLATMKVPSHRRMRRLPSAPLAIEYRPATPPPIRYAQFVDALLTGNAASAIDKVRNLRGNQHKHPSERFLPETARLQLAVLVGA